MNKFIRITTVWLVWAAFGLLMTVIYEYLRTVGFIYDNPEPEHGPTWNSRKMIFFVMSCLFFVITIAKSVQIIDEKKED